MAAYTAVITTIHMADITAASAQTTPWDHTGMAAIPVGLALGVAFAGWVLVAACRLFPVAVAAGSPVAASMAAELAVAASMAAGSAVVAFMVVAVAGTVRASSAGRDQGPDKDAR